jgi:hypothetical protein
MDFAQLNKSRRASTVFALQLTAELFHLLHCFTEARIEVLATKGPALSMRCYGDPGMRQYSDLDLILHQADIRRLTELMLHLGYEPRVPLAAIDAQKIPGEYVFRKPGTNISIEFHTERTLRYHPRPLRIHSLFQHSTHITIDGREIPVPSLEDELVLISIHGAKHFWERLMWVADVAALCLSSPALDWERALYISAEVGAQRMLCLALRLASDLLGLNVPSQLAAAIQSDRAVSNLAAQIKTRLASTTPEPTGILARAAFRMRMRGDLLSGVAYLLRLSLSPTEDDWTSGEEGKRTISEIISRPFRLARKHRRRSTD